MMVRFAASPLILFFSRGGKRDFYLGYEVMSGYLLSRADALRRRASVDGPPSGLK